MRPSSLAMALVLLLFVVGLPGDVIAQGARRYVDPRTVTDTAAGPFSGGVLVGNTFYLAGKIGLTADQKVPASAAEEARLVLNDVRSEEHTSELQSQSNLVCRLLLEKKK